MVSFEFNLIFQLDSQQRIEALTILVASNLTRSLSIVSDTISIESTIPSKERTSSFAIDHGEVIPGQSSPLPLMNQVNMIYLLFSLSTYTYPLMFSSYEFVRIVVITFQRYDH
jgi:hypothetical protein